MKKKLLLVVMWVLVWGMIFQTGCKTADETDASQFTLTVILSEGVSGVPASGAHTYEQGDIVSYSYALAEGYSNLTVTLDGTEVPASGTITMNANHILNAQTDALFDVRGRWKGFMVWPINSPYWILDIYFDVECSGDISSGGVTGNMDLLQSKAIGTYTVDGNEVRFDIEGQILPPPTIVTSIALSSSEINKGEVKAINGFMFFYSSPLIFWGTAENNNRVTGKWESKFMYFTSTSAVTAKTTLGVPGGTFWMERE